MPKYFVRYLDHKKPEGFRHLDGIEHPTLEAAVDSIYAYHSDPDANFNGGHGLTYEVRALLPDERTNTVVWRITSGPVSEVVTNKESS